MSRTGLMTRARLWAVLGLLLSAVPASAQTTYTWTGGSTADANWFTPENWVSGGNPTVPVSDITGTLLDFGGTTRLSNVLDFSLSANQLTYNSTAGAFTTTGSTQTLTLGSGGIQVAAGNANNQTFSAGLALGANQSWTNNGTGTFTAGGPVNMGANALTFNGTGNSQITGQITGSGTLAVAGANTLTLTNSTSSSTFTGAINVSGGGVLSYSFNSNLGNTAGSGVITLDSGTLRNTSVGGTAGRFSPANRNIVLGSGGGTLSWDGTAGQQIIVETGTVISGTGGLTKAGTGLIAIATPATYSGPTVVEAGTLRTRSVNNVLPVGTAVTVNAGATLDIGSNLNQRVGSLSGAGAVTINNGIFTVGDANSTSFTGAITGTASSRFVKEGTGTLTLGGVNTYGSTATNATTVNAGTLALATGSSLGATTDTSAVLVNINGTLAGSGTVNNRTTIAAGGAVRGGVTGTTETLTFNNNLTLTSSAANNAILRVEANRIGVNTTSASLLSVTGAGVFNLNLGASNAFTIDLVDGSLPLDPTESYSVILATVGTAGNIQLNGGSLAANTVIDPSRYVLRSDSFVGTSLFVDALGTSLVLTFAPVPEPATVLLVAAGALAAGRAVRRRFLA